MTFFGHQNFDENESILDFIFDVSSCSPRIDISNDVPCASNGDSIPKLPPREIDVPIYCDRAHILAFHLLGLGFWMFRVFHCLSIIYRPSSLIVTQISEACSRHISSHR
jgi:hypothetical protein